MIQIPLINSDKFALVDDADYELVKGYAWWEHKVLDPNSESSGLSYAYGVKLPRKRGNERVVKMHRLILNKTNPKEIVDHIDHNGLNNTRANLRQITVAQNAQRARFTAETNPRKRHSKYRGVSYLGWHGRYLAYLNVNGKREYLGYFDTEEEAARARDKRAKELHGEFVRLNYAED